MKFYTSKKDIIKNLEDTQKEFSFEDIKQKEGIYKPMGYGDCYFVVLKNDAKDTSVLFVEKDPDTIKCVEPADNSWESESFRFKRCGDSMLLLDIV